MNRTLSPHSATPASNIDQSAPSNPRNRLSLVARTVMTSLGVYSDFGLDPLNLCLALSSISNFCIIRRSGSLSEVSSKF
jgi:hypothetical protein